MDSQFDDAVKAAKEAKLEIADLEKTRAEANSTLQAERERLAQAEETAAGVLMDTAAKLSTAREKLQRALQTINDAPVTADAKTLTVGVGAMLAGAIKETPSVLSQEEADAEAAAEINVDGDAYINRGRPRGYAFP